MHLVEKNQNFTVANIYLPTSGWSRKRKSLQLLRKALHPEYNFLGGDFNFVESMDDRHYHSVAEASAQLRHKRPPKNFMQQWSQFKTDFGLIELKSSVFTRMSRISRKGVTGITAAKLDRFYIPLCMAEIDLLKPKVAIPQYRPEKKRLSDHIPLTLGYFPATTYSKTQRNYKKYSELMTTKKFQDAIRKDWGIADIPRSPYGQLNLFQKLIVLEIKKHKMMPKLHLSILEEIKILSDLLRILELSRDYTRANELLTLYPRFITLIQMSQSGDSLDTSLIK